MSLHAALRRARPALAVIRTVPPVVPMLVVAGIAAVSSIDLGRSARVVFLAAAGGLLVAATEASWRWSVARHHPPVPDAGHKAAGVPSLIGAVIWGVLVAAAAWAVDVGVNALGLHSWPALLAGAGGAVLATAALVFARPESPGVTSERRPAPAPWRRGRRLSRDTTLARPGRQPR